MDDKNLSALMSLKNKLSTERLQQAKEQAEERKKQDERLKKRCVICKQIFRIPKHLANRPPGMCYGCKCERKNTSGQRSSAKKGLPPSRTEYTSVSVYQGGAPGLGKRH